VTAAAKIDAPRHWSALAAEERLPFLVCWPRLLPDMLCCWLLEAFTRCVRSMRARSLQAECGAAAGPAWHRAPTGVHGKQDAPAAGAAAAAGPSAERPATVVCRRKVRHAADAELAHACMSTPASGCCCSHRTL